MMIQSSCCCCGACVNVCPRAALELRGDRLVLLEERCMEHPCRRWNCGLCAKVCPVGAILR